MTIEVVATKQYYSLAYANVFSFFSIVKLWKGKQEDHFFHLTGFTILEGKPK